MQGQKLQGDIIKRPINPPQKYMWGCPSCHSRYFNDYYWVCPRCGKTYPTEPMTLGVRNGALVRIHPICTENCFVKCERCGHKIDYGDNCPQCDAPRLKINLERRELKTCLKCAAPLSKTEIDPDDPTFGITSTGSASYPTSTVESSGAGGGAAAYDNGYREATKCTMTVAGTIIKIGVNWGNTTASNFRMAVYSDSSGPANLLTETASVAASGTGFQDIACTSYYAAAGDYWIALQTTAARQVYRTSGVRWYCTFTYGAFPSTWSNATNINDIFCWNYRISFARIKGYINFTKATLALAATSVTSVSFYSHATGNFYAGIYTDVSGPAVLKWTSGSTAASATAWTTVLISAGTPNTLALATGDYWLAWQWDSANAGPSYAAGSANTGGYKAQAYGAFPDPLTGETLNTDNWSFYVTYVAYYVTGIVRDGATGAAIAGATVLLFKTSDKSYIGTATSDVNGSYSIATEDNVTGHFVRAYKDGSPNLFGTTDDDLVGA